MFRSVFALNKLFLTFSDHSSLVPLQNLNNFKWSTIHYKIVYFQTIENSIELKSKKGEANFECVTSAWENEGQNFYDYMQKNLIGFASDEAGNNVDIILIMNNNRWF